MPGLETLQSCQGEPGRRRGYVHFSLGESGWEGLCRFVFETLAPAIRERMEDDATVVVEANLADRPIGTINFSTDAAGSLATGAEGNGIELCTVGSGALVAGNAERFAVAWRIGCAGTHGGNVVGVPAPTRELRRAASNVALRAGAARALTPAARAPQGRSFRFL